MTNTGSSSGTDISTLGGLMSSVYSNYYAGDVIGDAELSTNTLESGVTITEAQ